MGPIQLKINRKGREEEDQSKIIKGQNLNKMVFEIERCLYA